MSENTTVINASIDDVWSVLSDGWLYPLWVVGASRMRDVDPDWPAVGSRIHHSVGAWPALIHDHTRVLAQQPSESITLRARAWPMGEAKVHITVTPVDDRTEVTMVEDVVSGPGLLVPGIARQPGLKWRNSETLHRLRLLVEGRAGRTQTR